MMTTMDGEYKIFTLRIEGVNMDSVLLSDIGHYLDDFAQLLGSDVQARFQGVTKGSINLKAKVRRESVIDVKTRGFLLRTGEGPDEAVRASERISRRMGVHRAKRATLLDPSDAKVIEIPVIRPTTSPADVPALSRTGSLQGQIIRIGGKQDVVTVDVQDVDGHVYGCRASRDMAKRLAQEIFGATVRVDGAGKWRRDEEGVWYVEDFLIADFDVLDGDPIESVLAEIRAVHSAWQRHEDPLSEHEKIRNGEST